MANYLTLTFVVRAPVDGPPIADRGLGVPFDDPRDLLTSDEVMFWAKEDGITLKALDLGADPDLWDDDQPSTKETA